MKRFFSPYVYVHVNGSWGRNVIFMMVLTVCFVDLQLFMDKEKAEELWLSRLMSLRQERLMGSPVS